MKELEKSITEARIEAKRVLCVFPLLRVGEAQGHRGEKGAEGAERAEVGEGPSGECC